MKNSLDLPGFDVEKLKELTNNSPKVYFMSQFDVFYYYQGGYVPQGYFSPFSAWIYKKDLTKFLQGLLDDHYYLVIPSNEIAGNDEISAGLRYNTKIEATNMQILFQHNK